MHGGNDKKPNKKKQATLRTRKSLGAPDDSEDDFKPSKAAAKPRKPTVTGAMKPKKPIATPTKVEDSDGEAILIPAAKVKAKKPPAKAKPKDDSDVEIVEAPAPKDKGKGKAASKRKMFASLQSFLFFTYLHSPAIIWTRTMIMRNLRRRRKRPIRLMSSKGKQRRRLQLIQVKRSPSLPRKRRNLQRRRAVVAMMRKTMTLV